MAVDALAGRLSEAEWLELVDVEGGENFASDLVLEILGRTETIIYNRYIEGQVLPYTVARAKDTMMHIVNWCFLQRDEGERDVSTNPTWCSDVEPTRPQTDSWARGVVPIIRQSNPVQTTVPTSIDVEDKNTPTSTKLSWAASTKKHHVEKKPSKTIESDVGNIRSSSVKIQQPKRPAKSAEAFSTKGGGSRRISNSEKHTDGRSFSAPTSNINKPKPPSSKSLKSFSRKSKIVNSGVTTSQTNYSIASHDTSDDIYGYTSSRHVSRTQSSGYDTSRSGEGDRKEEMLPPPADPLEIMGAATCAELDAITEFEERGVEYYYDHSGILTECHRPDPSRLPMTAVLAEVSISSTNDPPSVGMSSNIASTGGSKVLQRTNTNAGKQGAKGNWIRNKPKFGRERRLIKRTSGNMSVEPTASTTSPVPINQGSLVANIMNSMPLAPGVVMRQGETVRRGPDSVTTQQQQQQQQQRTNDPALFSFNAVPPITGPMKNPTVRNKNVVV